METRICVKCEIEKAINEFSWKNKSLNKLQSKCKVCVGELDKERYANDETRQTKIRDRANEQKKINKEFVIRYKKLLTCSRCGDDRWYVLDFHHLNDKDYCISDMIKRGSSLKRIKEEIKKCEPLCANCHREIHYLEKQE